MSCSGCGKRRELIREAKQAIRKRQLRIAADRLAEVLRSAAHDARRMTTWRKQKV